MKIFAFHRGRVAAIAFLLVLLPAAYPQGEQAPAQQNQPAAGEPQNVIKSNTRLVIVDVVATDSKGAPVADLMEKDFTVMESGRPQRIGSFSFQSPALPVEPPAQLPPNVITNVPRTQSTSLNVILLDRINGESRSHVYAQDRIVKYLESGAAIQPTAVFILDKKLSLVHDFTRDNKALKDALNRVRPGGAARVAQADIAASPFATVGDFHTDENSIEFTLRALKQLTKTLAGYPGRKNLIWVSEAFPVSLTIEGLQHRDSGNALLIARSNPGNGADSTKPGGDPTALPVATQDALNAQAAAGAPDSIAPGTGHTYAAEMAKITDALMDAHVALYPVDAAGMGQADRLAAQTNMQDMADRTGGRAYINRNDIETAISSSANDGSTYYAISYYPENRVWDGRFRKIEVRTNRPGVNLHYRTGYYALNPEITAKQDSAELDEEFARAMAFDSPGFAGLRFQASVVPPSEKMQKVTVNFAIDPHSVIFERRDDGLEHGSVSCAVAAFHEKGDPVKGFQVKVATVPATLKPDQYQKLLQQYYPCKREIELKPGRYMLRLGAMDRNSRLIGTLITPLTVN